MALWARRKRDILETSADGRPTAGSIEAAGGFYPAELRKAAIIVDGYVAEAGLDRRRPNGRR